MQVWKAMGHTADFGIDLGSVNTVIANGRGEVVFNEPTCIAKRATDARPVAYGYEAATMIGKSPVPLQVLYPFSRSRLVDADTLHTFLQKTLMAIGLNGSRRATASLPMSSIVSTTERNMVARIGKELGLARVSFVPEVVASAITYRGDRDPEQPLAILDLGAEICSWGVVRKGRVETSGSLEMGMKDLTEDLIAFLRLRYGLRLARSQAESVLITLGCRGFRNTALPARVGCQSIFSGKLTSQVVTSGDVTQAIGARLDELFRHIKTFFDEQPEKVLRPFLDEGVSLCGGFALLPELPLHLSKQIGLTVTTGKRPLQSAALGAARAIVFF